MAPTKNVNRLTQKVVKKKVIKSNSVKAPLKTPTVLKVKIGNLNSKPPKIERKVTRQRKIELANEVALEQLSNLTEPKVSLSTLPPTMPVPIKIEPIATEEVPKSAFKLKRKLPIKAQESDEPVKKAAKPECKPKRVRKPTLKATESSQLKSPLRSNIQSDSEPESWQIIYKRPGPKSKTIVPIDIPKAIKLNEVKCNIPILSLQKVRTAKAKSDPVQTQQKVNDITEPVDSDGTPRTATRQSAKKKQTQKKPAVEDTKKTVTAKPKGRTRSKFANERSDGTKKITRSKGKVLKMDIKSAASILENALKGPANVKTRSNSVNSTISNLSWTRDISTASSLSETTTCVTVCSTDFVRFDNKLPFVQIEDNVEQLTAKQNVNDKLLEDSSSSDSDSSDSSTDSELDVSNEPELNLSTSSLSKSTQYESSENTKLLSIEMDKLTNSLKNFYTEMGKWLAFDDDTDSFSTILEAMNLEKDVISSCENFSSILGDCAHKSSPEKVAEVNDVVQDKMKPVEDDFDQNQEDIPRITGDINILESPAKSTSSETFTSDNCNYMPFDGKICDDEDALSLYAESITGIESSRISSISNLSIQEQIPKPIQRSQEETYVPKPTRPWLSERYNYLPTRIEKETSKRDVPVKTIEPNMIEKQNADSSSINNELSKKAMERVENKTELAPVTNEEAKPRRIFSRYQPVQDIKSVLYRGYCFFFLAYSCKNNNCRFPHIDIEPGILNCRLALLTEDSIIEEYLLMVKYKNLRRKFGLLYMKECARRNATRLLIEMAIDLGLGVAERLNNVLNVAALEITLLHLNTVSFDVCEDLLTYEHNNRMLCDALLHCMAYAQNFSQFKQVFVKLTQYMEEIKRSVDIATVRNILERVCILPCEEAIARAMLSLMKNTDARIFENSMTKSFEFQLSNTENNVYEQYLMAKKEAMEALLRLEQDPSTSESSVPRVGREGPRHPSPDTTNLDGLKKSQVQTTFKRTVDTDAIRHLFKSPANPAPKPRHTAPRAWRRGTGYIVQARQLANRRIYMNTAVCTTVQRD